MTEESAQIFYLFPKRQKLHAFLNTSSACAYELLDAATFISDEITGMDLTEAHRATIIELCDSFAGTKHDVCNDLADMPRLYSWDFRGCRLCITRIIDAITDDMKLLRAVTNSLDEDGADLAYMLLAETGMHLLASFNQVQAATAALRAEIH